MSKEIKISKPLALGIHCAHDASVALCNPHGIMFSIQEERLTRIKHYYGFPEKAIEATFKYCGLLPSDIDILAFTSGSLLYPEHKNSVIIDITGKRIHLNELKDKNWGYWIKRAILNEFGWFGITKSPWGEFSERHYLKKKNFLAKLGLMDEKITYFYVTHHRAHAASAFHLSGFNKACTITVDGKGDGLSAAIFKGHKDGRMELLKSSKAEDSLGAFYQAATEALGFIPVDSEYKTMGLAALGKNSSTKNPFKGIIHVKNGVFKSKIGWRYRSFNKFNPEKKVLNPLASVAQTEDFKKILQSYSREDFAYYAQKHLEENLLQYAKDALKITNCKDLVAAGGVMLNVKANALIRDKLKPPHFFVFPDASDSGLAAGSALEALYQTGCLRKPILFESPFLGTSFKDIEIENELLRFSKKYKLQVKKGYLKLITEKLISGKVIGTFIGRLETGPRALGNRSVLADPRSNKVKDRINLILKGREWFVPFAPAVLEEDAHLYWDGSIDYPYMTFTVKASKYAKTKIPAVVHVDGTMRPEVVTKDFNPWLYELLQEFKKHTGIGVLLNTSFNRHGLPIVGRPSDAFEHLINGWVDGLYLGKWYIERSGI